MSLSPHPLEDVGIQMRAPDMSRLQQRNRTRPTRRFIDAGSCDPSQYISATHGEPLQDFIRPAAHCSRLRNLLPIRPNADRMNPMAAEEQKERLEAIREAIRSFPTGPGLYFMKDAQDTVLYIGKAKNLRSRVASYFQPSADLAASRGARIVEMIAKVQTVDYLETKSEVDAILQEARLINEIRPPYNTSMVYSKTFPNLEITTREQFPGVYITRNPKNPRNRLFGPFTGAHDLRGALVVLQKIYKFRTCNLDIREEDDKRRFFRPCILPQPVHCPCAYESAARDTQDHQRSDQISPVEAFHVLRKLRRHGGSRGRQTTRPPQSTATAYVSSTARRTRHRGRQRPAGGFATDPSEPCQTASCSDLKRPFASSKASTSPTSPDRDGRLHGPVHRRPSFQDGYRHTASGRWRAWRPAAFEK